MSGRPTALFPLFAGLETLEGVGPKTAALLEQLHVLKPRDLIFTLPYSGIDRAVRPSVLGLDFPTVATVEVEVIQHHPARARGRPRRVQVEDRDTTFELVFFHARGEYLQKILPVGGRRVVSGKLEMFDSVIQMTHPDHILPLEEAADLPLFEPVYPLTAGVSQKVMYKATRAALARMPELDEWADAEQLRQAGWPTWAASAQAAHAPTCLADLTATAPARERLAYDEFFAHQLTLALARINRRTGKGRVRAGDGGLPA